MWTNYKNEFVWGIFVFVMVFFSINTLFNLGNSLRNGFPVVKTAAVSELSVPKLQMETKKKPVISAPKKKNIKLAFVGDIMLDRGVKYSVYKNFSGNYSELFSKVEDQLRAYDILFANLEGPISDKGADGGNLYSFRFEPGVVPALDQAGVDVLSIANNHIYNWGETALEDTMQLLSQAGVTYIGGGRFGSDAYQEKIISVAGIRIAFLAFSEFNEGGTQASSSEPGIAIISETAIKDSISSAKEKADLVVVSFHFGEEYDESPNNYQRKYAELAIDFGADLVVGHHPHVVQALEQYRNTYIVYSLGNFIFDQHFSAETMQGGLLEVEVDTKNKQIEGVFLRKVFLNKFFQIEGIK